MSGPYPHSTKTFNDIQQLLLQLTQISNQVEAAYKLLSVLKDDSLADAIGSIKDQAPDQAKTMDLLAAMTAEVSYSTALDTGLSVIKGTLGVLNKLVSSAKDVLPDAVRAQADHATIQINWGDKMPPKEVADALEKALGELSSTFMGGILAHVVDVERKNKDELEK